MRAHLERRLLRRRGRLGTASLDGGVDLLRLLRRLGRDADAGKAGGEHGYLFVCRNADDDIAPLPGVTFWLRVSRRCVGTRVMTVRYSKKS